VHGGKSRTTDPQAARGRGKKKRTLFELHIRGAPNAGVRSARRGEGETPHQGKNQKKMRPRASQKVKLRKRTLTKNPKKKKTTTKGSNEGRRFVRWPKPKMGGRGTSFRGGENVCLDHEKDGLEKTEGKVSNKKSG